MPAGIVRFLFSAFSSLTDLIFPRLCVACETSLAGGELFLCSACLADFPFSDEAFTSGDEVLRRMDEAYRPEKFHSLFYYNKYSDYRHLIYALKYRSKKELGFYLGQMLGERMLGKTDADCIIPVPLHPKRERERGFNQSLFIASGVADILKIEVWDDVVFRTVNNVSQTGKGTEERWQNAANIFVLKNAEKIQGRHVLVIDDVITTGATIGSCLEVMAQVENIRFTLACLAQTKS